MVRCEVWGVRGESKHRCASVSSLQQTSMSCVLCASLSRCCCVVWQAEIVNDGQTTFFPAKPVFSRAGLSGIKAGAVDFLISQRMDNE